jgi:hypothetical protein
MSLIMPGSRVRFPSLSTNTLHLLVATNGCRYWGYNYRFCGKQKNAGPWCPPEVTQSMARERHQYARQLLADGIDPSAEQPGAGKTFEAVARQWACALERQPAPAACLLCIAPPVRVSPPLCSCRRRCGPSPACCSLQTGYPERQDDTRHHVRHLPFSAGNGRSYAGPQSSGSCRPQGRQ